MALFKFGSDANASETTNSRGRAGRVGSAETVDELRRRAKQRLIGAVALVLLGVIGFPLLFDSQPRPIGVDIPIEIPDKTKAAPLAQPSAAKPPAQSAKPALASPAKAPAPAKVADAASLDEKEEIVATKPSVASASAAAVAAKTAVKPDTKAVATSEAKVATKPDTKPPTKPEPKTEAKASAPEDAAKAKALLDGKNAATGAATAERFIVQVGAFADAAKAREVRLKVERAGLKTYTQVVETADGKRIRVRVGPYPSKAEADKAANTITGLDLPAAILTL